MANTLTEMEDAMKGQELDRSLLVNKAFSNRELARMMHVSATTIRRHRSLMGVETSRPGWDHRNSPNNSFYGEATYPDGWRIEQGHPCLHCEHYPPDVDTRTSPCTRCHARIEWCAAQ